MKLICSSHLEIGEFARSTGCHSVSQPEEGKILTMEDLGITGTPIEKEAFSYLHRFRTAGHFGRVDGYH